MDTDLQLLSRYAHSRDAEAFTQLVRRHAGMVFAAARRVTEDHHDAEEVAQNCFLDLSRQAGSIQGSVAGWLHSVATNRANMCNREAGRRRKRERVASRPEGVIATEAPWEEIAPLVDAALAELPEEWRLPVVLYYLEGRGQSEVAAELGLNQSTVSRRLEAGVAALREKLQAAGIEAPCVALPAMLAQHAITAVPKTLVAALGKLAVSGLVPTTSATTATAGASSLAAKGTMALGVKVAAAVIITATLCTAGVALLPKRAVVTTALATNAPNISEEAKAILARLKAEIAQGMGDGVGIWTDTEIDVFHANPAPPLPEGLALCAQQASSKLYLAYFVGRNHQWGNPKAVLPNGWPTPSLDETLQFIDQLKGRELSVTDGHLWWRSEFGKGGQNSLISSRVDGDGEAIPHIPNALSRVWFFLNSLVERDNARISSADVIRRPENPALVGLHVICEETTPNPHPRRSEETCWLDPSRNDVPVEEDVQLYDRHGHVDQSGKYEYLEYAQLPDARWYPTHWRLTANAGNDNRCDDYRVTFIPGKLLDPKWFGGPTARFAGNVKTAPDDPSHGVAAASHAVTTAATTVAKSNWWPWLLAVLTFGGAGILFIFQRRKASALSPLQRFKGPRRQ